MAAASGEDQIRRGSGRSIRRSRPAPAKLRVGVWAGDPRALYGVAAETKSRIALRGVVMARLFKKSDAAKRSFWERVKDVALLDVGVLVRGGVSEGSLEALEELLLESDFGVPVTMRLV